MKGFFSVVVGLSRYIYAIAGVCLAFLMLLTSADVLMRALFNSPITGIYDLTMLSGGIICGFALPVSTLRKVHVQMTFLTDHLSDGVNEILRVITRILGVLLFLFFSWTLVEYGISLYRGAETSQTLHVPVYPIVFSIGVGCLLNAVIILRQLFYKEEAI